MSNIKKVAKIKKLRRISKVLDNAIAIPGTKLRFGLDPILGLLPGGGDTITGGLSAYIVVEAAKMGLPREIIGQMIVNILIDSFAGTIPVLGDLFDFGWKSNVKNIELLEKHLDLGEPEKSNPLLVFGLILLLTMIVLGFAALTFFSVRFFWNLISQ
ncbi:DUF4112 domain-containing protein [Waterburya agarophytonicola K14]|uniref:DUF4112 domain-containing protein n=1 Tax=Waterburya agarophytonicola KI4 TaxID=2874699 RepID=A0A964BUR3_9CYAN|nr:DUF4112 domain-containing protein [Waterburya agarophytonicola]MCC0179166.1 DUF4112 domain-containing protein [Waterburya agarophytonicola KI4]